MLGAVAKVYHRVRFALWVAGVRLRLARFGMRLDVSAPHGARARTWPSLDMLGTERGGTLTLRLGRDVKLGHDLVISIETGTDNTIDLGDHMTIEAWCRLEMRGGKIVWGANGQIRDQALLKTSSIIEAGDTALLGRGVIIHAAAGVFLADRTGVGERTSLIDSDHDIHGTDEWFMDRPSRMGPIKIGVNTLVLTNVLVLRSTTLGRNSVVAAGAILMGGEFPDGHLIAGVPATAKRPLAPV